MRSQTCHDEVRREAIPHCVGTSHSADTRNSSPFRFLHSEVLEPR